MRGVGGPLLCIGDLLSDVGEPEVGSGRDQSHLLSPTASSPSSPHSLDRRPADLTKLFQESYDQLNEALAGTDHSWTSLTLKLCTALETANKLIKSTNTNVVVLSEKVGELEDSIKKGDSAVSAVRSIHSSLCQKLNPTTAAKSNTT